MNARNTRRSFLRVKRLHTSPTLLHARGVKCMSKAGLVKGGVLNTTFMLCSELKISILKSGLECSGLFAMWHQQVNCKISLVHSAIDQKTSVPWNIRVDNFQEQLRSYCFGLEYSTTPHKFWIKIIIINKCLQRSTRPKERSWKKTLPGLCSFWYWCSFSSHFAVRCVQNRHSHALGS